MGAVHPARRTSVSDELQRGSFRQVRPSVRARPIRPVLLSTAGYLARQSVEPARRALRRETARTMEAAAADACSEPGANLVGPEGLIGNSELVTHAVRRIVCQPRDPTDAGFIRLFRLYQLHKRGAPMTERLHPPGMVPQRSGDRVHERVPISASATLCSNASGLTRSWNTRAMTRCGG
jgi:hypothetical protein